MAHRTALPQRMQDLEQRLEKQKAQNNEMRAALERARAVCYVLMCDEVSVFMSMYGYCIYISM